MFGGFGPVVAGSAYQYNRYMRTFSISSLAVSLLADITVCSRLAWMDSSGSEVRGRSKLFQQLSKASIFSNNRYKEKTKKTF